MVGRGCSLLHRELRARPVSQLVGVHPRPETRLASGLQHRPRLVDVEGALLAEHVDPPRAASACVEHRSAHEVDVGVGATGVLRGQGMSSEKRHVVGDAGSELDETPFVLDIQPIAGLHLDMRRSCSERLVPPSDGIGAELLGRCGTGRRDRRHDPARRVRRSRHPRGELFGAVTGKHEMRVAVDEPGDHARAFSADALVGLRTRPLDADDAACVDHERGVLHEAETTAPTRWIVGDQQPDVVDDEGHRFAPRGPHRAVQLGRDVDRDVRAITHDFVSGDHHTGDVVCRRRERERRREER